MYSTPPPSIPPSLVPYVKSYGPNGGFFCRDALSIHCDHQFMMLSAQQSKQSKRPPNSTSSNVTRWRTLFSRNRIIQALFSGALAFLERNFEGHSNVETVLNFLSPVYKDSYWDSHREEVKDAFVTSWDAYAKYTWGKSIDSLVYTSSFPIGAHTDPSQLLNASHLYQCC
jgi:hypothetical protein